VAVREVPLERPSGGTAFRQVSDLGDEGSRRDFVLTLDWSARHGSSAGATLTDAGAGRPGADAPEHVTGAWRLSLATLEGRTLVAGRVLAEGALLLGQLVDAERPDGDLVVVTTGNDPPGLDDLGVAARLLHLTGDDLQAVIDARRNA
jgi:hypothetical protein